MFLSGIEIETAHRQNLHELILGAQGVALNATLQTHVARIEEHNRALRQKEGAIPAATRGTLSVDTFCALPEDPDIDASIAAAERNLSAARSANAIRQQAEFAAAALPIFDIAGSGHLSGSAGSALVLQTKSSARPTSPSYGRSSTTPIVSITTRIQRGKPLRSTTKN